MAGKRKKKSNAKSKVKRNYKDSVFRCLFESKENALSLYNALNDSDYTDVNDLTIVVLKDAVYIGVRHDNAFILHDTLNLYEHQSTYCPNMPIRGLDYFGDMYRQYMEEVEGSWNRVYSSTLIRIPSPKFYVFYNGADDQPERKDLLLSDAYEGEGDVEVVAHMININKGRNKALMDKCKTLSDYSEFIYRVRVSLAKNVNMEDAVEDAIESCIRDGVLADFLRKERSKVARALYSGLTEKEWKQLKQYELEKAREEARVEGHAEGREEGREEGRAEGRAEGREEGRAEGRAEGREEGRAEGREEGRAEGREEGRAEGRAEGREEGRAEGRTEGVTMRAVDDVDRLMTRKGYSLEEACDMLEFSLEKYNEYKNRNPKE